MTAGSPGSLPAPGFLPAPGSMAASGMTQVQRRVTLAVCLIVGMSLLMAAGLTFLVTPMAESLGLADNVVEDVLAIPSAAAVIMVFSAGQLGDRLGARRTLVIASIAFSIGSALLVVASDEYPVQIGLAICGAAAVTMQIVGVSLLQQATVDGPAQVSAFTSFGVVFPLAFLVFPVATAALLEVADWRLIPATWIVAGLAMLVLTLLLVERSPRGRVSGEWATPLLAGFAFAAAARAFAEIEDVALDPPLILVSVAVALIAGIACVVVMRRRAQPSFTLAPIRGRQLPLLLACVALVSLSGLLTYVSIAIEYLYDLTPYDAALAVIPAQVGAIVGAKVMAQRAMRRWGGPRAIQVLMLALAATMLPLVLLSSTTPLWFLVAVATLFSFVWMAVLTVLNAEVMRRAPRERTGAVSSFRTAASSFGAAVGVGILGTIVLSSVALDEGAAAMSGSDLAVLVDRLRLAGLLASLIAVLGWVVASAVRRRSDAQELAPVS